MQRLVILAAAVLGFAACNNEITGLEPASDPTTETFAPSLQVDVATMEKTSSGVFYEDIIVGTGTEATVDADSVAITYAGWLKDGTLFDLGTNIRFDLDDVVKGFRDGVIGMKIGGKRKLVVPSELGYGNRARRSSIEGVTIPRQSTLVFDIELLNVFNPAP